MFIQSRKNKNRTHKHHSQLCHYNFSVIHVMQFVMFVSFAFFSFGWRPISGLGFLALWGLGCYFVLGSWFSALARIGHSPFFGYFTVSAVRCIKSQRLSCILRYHILSQIISSFITTCVYGMILGDPNR